MENRNRISVFLIAVVVGLISLACTRSSGSGATRSGGLVESFLRGNGQLLYFVKPLDFKSENGDVFSADFTYNAWEDSLGNVVCNFSVFSETKYLKMGNLLL